MNRWRARSTSYCVRSTALRRSAPAIGAKPRGIIAEHRLMLFKLVPGDIARMRIPDERRPFLTRELVVLPILMALPRAPIDERARVARVVQHPERARMVEG